MESRFECLSPKKLQAIRKIFGKMTYGDGTISVDKFIDLNQKLGKVLTKEEVIRGMQEIDLNGDGKVEFFEFKKELEKLKAYRNENWRLFLAIDSNHDSKLSGKEWINLQKKVNGDTSREAAKQWKIKADKNKDGFVSCPEFLQSYKKE